MSHIEQEIEQIADQLEKSNQTPRERLFETIRKLGPIEIKARLATLEKSEKELLLDALKEMKKAVEMDKNYAASYLKNKIDETVIQEDKADDDQDEKLVLNSPEAVTVNHQGTPTPGWEGQVIKAKKDMSKEDAKDKIMDMEEKEHGIKNPKKLVEAEKKEHGMKKSVEILRAHAQNFLSMLPDSLEDIEKAHVGFEAVSRNAAEHGAEDPDAVAAAVGRKKYGKEGMAKLAAAGRKKHVKKSEDTMEKAAECSDKKKRCVREVKEEGKGKNAYAICNAAMKKSDAESKAQAKEALVEIKKSIEKQLKELGEQPTPELVKSEMKRLLAEEDQDGDAPEMNEKTRANKESVPALEMGKDNKEAQKKVNDEKQGIKKAIWAGEQDLLKARTNGRNHHFSMEQYIDEVLANASKEGEPIQKSVDKKEDLNDIIEKGGDANWDMVNTDRLLKANGEKVKGKFVKSFEDNEIAQALGLTDEEAKKILGE